MKEMSRERSRIPAPMCSIDSPTVPVIAKFAAQVQAPSGDAYIRVESARGDMGLVLRQATARVPVSEPHMCALSSPL